MALIIFPEHNEKLSSRMHSANGIALSACHPRQIQPAKKGERTIFGIDCTNRLEGGWRFDTT